jgi:hypothetical protein
MSDSNGGETGPELTAMRRIGVGASGTKVQVDIEYLRYYLLYLHRSGTLEESIYAQY